VIQAPGLFEGYAPETFPGLDQAIQFQNWTLAQQQYNILTQLIGQAAAVLSGN